MNFKLDLIYFLLSGHDNEKTSNNEGSTDQPRHRVAWKGDVYSQSLGNEKSGYVRYLGLVQLLLLYGVVDLSLKTLIKRIHLMKMYDG